MSKGIAYLEYQPVLKIKSCYGWTTNKVREYASNDWGDISIFYLIIIIITFKYFKPLLKDQLGNLGKGCRNFVSCSLFANFLNV